MLQNGLAAAAGTDDAEKNPVVGAQHLVPRAGGQSGANHGGASSKLPASQRTLSRVFVVSWFGPLKFPLRKGGTQRGCLGKWERGLRTARRGIESLNSESPSGAHASPFPKGIFTASV